MVVGSSDNRASRVLAALFALAIVVAVWCVARIVEATPPAVTGSIPGEHADFATADATLRDSTTESPDTDAGNERQLVASVGTAGNRSSTLRVRLVGLEADAPWNAEVRLRLESQDRAAFAFLLHDVEQRPDAEGQCEFTLPAWWFRTTDQRWRLTSHSNNYREVDREGTGAFDPSGELELRVRPIHSLHGRVIDTRGTPIPGADVSVFETSNDAAAWRRIGGGTTDEHGVWRAEGDAYGELCVIADGQHRARWIVGHSDDDRPAEEVVEQWLAAQKTAAAQPDGLLPASVFVDARGAASREVPDLVLHPGNRLRGRIVWPDGTPVRGVGVCNGSTPTTHHGQFAHTDDDGGFSFVLAAPAPTRLSIGGLQDNVVIGPPIERTFDPVTPADIVLPKPTTVRIVGAGTAAAATIEFEGDRSMSVGDERGRRVLPTSDVRIRAVAERQRSEWRTIGPATHGATIDLDIGAITASTVEVVFDDAIRMSSIEVHARRADGTTMRETVSRDERSQPLQVLLEPGLYDVRIATRSAGSVSRYLVPWSQRVAIGAAPARIDVPTTLGGRFTLAVFDEHGSRTGGTCEVRDEHDVEIAGSFSSVGGWSTVTLPDRTFPADGVGRFADALPAGAYELTVKCPGQEPRRERITIREREVTEVRVRL